MRSLFRPRGLGAVVGLVAVWCGLWGEVSVANVLSGALLAFATVAVVIRPRPGPIRLRPLLAFVVLVARDLVESTVSVAREVLTPTDYTDEAVVEVPVGSASRPTILLLVGAVTLTPGTAAVHSDPVRGTVTLHVLHRERVEPTVAHLHELARLARETFPPAPEESTP